MKRFFLASLLVLGASCSSHHEKEAINTVKVKEVAEDISLPLNLFKEFEKELEEEFKSVSPVFIFMPLQVQFLETHDGRGVLKDTAIQFDLEKGGGKVDLKEVVSGQGSFYMHFPAEQFASTLEVTHLYYISQAPVKNIQGEAFGLGCGKWIDLKDSFKKFTKPSNLKFNTTGLRHLHVLAGHYVFVLKQGNQIYLSQLTITDSRFPEALCTSLGAHE